MVVTPHNLDESSDQVPTRLSGLAIVPLVGEGDEIVGRVLARLVEAEFISAKTLSWRSLRSEKIKQPRTGGALCLLFGGGVTFGHLRGQYGSFYAERAS
jgi:hypothetical protein